MTQDKNAINLNGRHFKITVDKNSGKISEASVYDGIKWNSLLAKGSKAGDNWNIQVKNIEIESHELNKISIDITRESNEWRICNKYEIFARGYIISTFEIEALRDEATAPQMLTVGMDLDKQAVFGNKYTIKNLTNENDDWTMPRALSVDFSTDERIVTNSINFLLESVTQDITVLACKKISEEKDDSRFLGWKLSRKRTYPFSKGFKYKNRWCITLSAMDNTPNKVRGQRIYHWYGFWPTYPSEDMLFEMAEYGCSILALHLQTFKYISGQDTFDKSELKRVVDRAKQLGMKVIFYCQPYDLSIESPYHKELADCTTECRKIWHSMKNTQIVTYEPYTGHDCDEMCLRCEKVYRHFFDTITKCLDEYGFDGLYVDFAWPAQGLCSNPKHGHELGLFNFYDYLRLFRELRKTIGEEKIMIGHGGGFLVGSDVIEGLDACLTGEAQKNIDPISIGQHFGTVPTLWTMHRRKQEIFRSKKAVVEFVREGISPQIGVGIMGTSVVASLDPAHFNEVLPLWQIWRSFPTEKATYYNYLTEKMVEMDNPEVDYSLYVTEENQVLLVIANAGGPIHDSTPTTSVNIRIDIKRIGLPEKMKCWRMKGNSYETFRIQEPIDITDGQISVPEIGLYEVMGFVLSPANPPKELIDLKQHLDGRWDRMPEIMRKKHKRLEEHDMLIDRFAKSPIAANKMKYEDFMKDRVTE